MKKSAELRSRKIKFSPSRVLPETQSDCAALSAFQAAPRKTIITENSIHTIKPIAPNSHKSTVLVPALETYFRLSEGLV
jgi:hypothetical protein